MASDVRSAMPCKFCAERVPVTLRVVHQEPGDDHGGFIVTFEVLDATPVVDHMKAKHAEIDLGAYT